MKHKSVIALRRKKKYGLLMGPFFGIKSVKEAEDVDKAASKFEAILFTSLYRKVPRHNLRWREAQRVRRKLCKGKRR